MADHDADRMNRNATALVASSVITAALGLLFWIVAARVLPTAEVGTGTAIVTSIVLLGNLATLGLRNGLIRFIAAAGVGAGRFIATSYALCATVAVAVAAGFAFGTPWWAHELTMLRHDLLTGAAFAAGTAVWTVFVLQDNVLTGLRHAVWVPIENVAYSVLKLALLAALVGAGAWALPLAWCVPALAMIVPVNVLIFRRLLPGHRRAPAEPIFSRRAIARFAAGDFGSDLVRMLGAEVVVLVVLGMRGAEDTAYVFFAITIAASGQLVSNNIVTAFVAESAARPAAAADLARRAGLNIGRLIVPGALIGAVAAPLVLGALGSAYVDNGTTLLRLLLLDSIPLAVAALATGWARYERAAGAMVRISLGVATTPLVGAAILAPRFGLDAIGWSALVGHTLLAAFLLSTILRPIWMGGDGGGVVGWLIARRRAVRQRRRERVVAAVLDELDATRHDQPSLEPRWLVPSDNDTAIVRVEHHESARVVKIALSADAAGGLRRHAAAVSAMHRVAAGTGTAERLPTVVEIAECAGHQLVIETACRGARPLAADHDTLAAIAGAIGDAHGLTRTSLDIGDRLIADLVTEPINVLSADRRLWPFLGEINALWSLLAGELGGQRLVMARTHGDCWIGNTLTERGPDGVEVTGLVDWEDSRPLGLPDADLAHLWLTAQGEHIGRTVVDVLTAGRPITLFSELAVDAPNPTLRAEVSVLLAWLEHVAAGLGRSSRFALGRLWLANNVEPVLRALGALDSGTGGDRPRGEPVGPMVRMVADGR